MRVLVVLMSAIMAVQAQTVVNIFLKPSFNNLKQQETALMETIRQDFISKNSNIDMRFNYFANTDDDEYLADLRLKLSNADSNDIDIYMLEESWMGSFPGKFLDLFSVQSASASLTQQISALAQRVSDHDTVGGKLLGLPFWADYGVLFYRDDILKQFNLQVPKTWTDIENSCTTLQSQAQQNNNIPPLCFATATKNQSVVQSATEWLASSSKTPLISGGLTFNFDDPGFETILNQLRNWTGSNFFNFDTTLNTDGCLQKWLDGSVVFYQGRASHFSQSVASGKLVNNNNNVFGVSRLPGLTDALTASTLGGYHFAVSQSSKKVEAAVQVLLYLTGKDVIGKRMVGLGLPSTYQGVYDDSKLCTPQTLPCSLLKSISADPFIRPASKIAPLWLPVVTSLVNDLAVFFQSTAIGGSDALRYAKDHINKIVQAASGASSSSVSPGASGTGTAGGSSPTGVQKSQGSDATAAAQEGTKGNVGVMAGLGLTATVVIIAIIVSVCVMVKRRRREKDGAMPSSSTTPLGRNDVELMDQDRLSPAKNKPAFDDTFKRPTGQQQQGYDYNDGTSWEPAQNPGAVGLTHMPSVYSSQSKTNYSQFTSDYDMPMNGSGNGREFGGSHVGNQSVYSASASAVGQYAPQPNPAFNNNNGMRINTVQTQKVMGPISPSTQVGYAARSPTSPKTQIGYEPYANVSTVSSKNPTFHPPTTAMMMNLNASSSGVNSTAPYQYEPPATRYIRSPGSLDLQYQTGEEEAVSVVGSESTNARSHGRGEGSILETMGRKHEVVHGYDAVQMDELTLTVGDLVTLRTAYD
ncbi:hypothetical protein HDU97_007007, partial [Phlyctochytrium planicorne]